MQLGTPPGLTTSWGGSTPLFVFCPGILGHSLSSDSGVGHRRSVVMAMALVVAPAQRTGAVRLIGVDMPETVDPRKPVER